VIAIVIARSRSDQSYTCLIQNDQGKVLLCEEGVSTESKARTAAETWVKEHVKKVVEECLKR